MLVPVGEGFAIELGVIVQAGGSVAAGTSSSIGDVVVAGGLLGGAQDERSRNKGKTVRFIT